MQQKSKIYIFCGLYYKSFTVVTYSRNDSSLYNKTTMVASVAMAWSVNYNRKVLKRTLVYYDRKIFIVQAVGLNLVKLFFGRY